MKEFDAVFPIPGHPPMWQDVGFVELPSRLGFWASVVPLPEHMVVRSVNHTIDEKRNKEKDDKKVKQWEKERAKLNRAR